MTIDRAGCVIDFVRRAALIGQGELSDAQLLDAFIVDGEEAAFAELLRRHGPMVLGVCRRVLGNLHDAEDAFQATFLILVRKADTVRPPDLVGRWLYGVAYRTALKARLIAKRCRQRERLAVELRAPKSDAGERREWHVLLDREITRLPEKYRTAVILCELKGLPRKEVARLLGLPEGTLSSRLAAARVRLARRLSRAGCLLSASALAGLPTAEAQAVPSALSNSTVSAATSSAAISRQVGSLVEGVLTSMWLSKLKIVPALVLLVAALGIGLAGRPDPARAGIPGDAKKEKKEVGASVHGTVSSVDAGKGTVTLSVMVAPGKKQTEEKSFTLSKDVKIILGDTLTKNETPPIGKIADLTPGTVVDAQLSVDGKQVVEIHAFGPGLQGGVKSVDATANTVTVLVKEKDGPAERTLQIARGAKILLNDGLKKETPGKEGSIADLTEGTRVSIRQSVDRKVALAIHVQGGVVHGTLKGLDTGNNSLTVTVKEDAQIVDKTFTIAKDAKVDSGAIAGKTVTVQLSVFDKTMATAVHVHESK